MIFKQPLVSIIIPVFNGSETIAASISSVLSQTYNSWELIIIDDGSTDDTEEVVQQFTRSNENIHLCKRTSTHKGAASCRNEGLEKAKGDYVIFLDSDDELKPICLEQRVELMEHDGHDFAVFLQQIKSTNPKTDGLEFNMPIVEKNSLIELFMKFEIPWQTTAPIWKIDFIKRIKGFDIAYSRMEDPDLHLRALIKATSFKCFYEYPSDCIYTLNPLEGEKAERINALAVQDCILFYTKIFDINWEIIFEKSHFRKILSDGFFHILKHFILGRIEVNFIACQNIYLLLRKNSVLTVFKKLQYKILISIYISNSKWVSIFRLRGFFYRLFLG